MFAKRSKPQAGRKRPRPEEDDTPADEETKIVAGDTLTLRKKEVVSSKPKEAEESIFADHKGTRELTKGDSKATATLQTETEVGKDTRAMHERNFAIHEKISKGELEEGVYRGQGAYRQYMKKSEGALSASKYSGLLGPTRGVLHARAICHFDYAPDVCKDYKETGYCGWGDTCKFLHDRSDYKSGWQIDKEFEEQQRLLEQKRAKKMARAMGGDVSDSSQSESESEDEDGIPFACLICRTKWGDCESDPVVTECQHYFCENCAMENFQKSSKCAVCSNSTNGIFNNASALIAKLRPKDGETEYAEKASKSASSAARTGGFYNMNADTEEVDSDDE